MNKLLFRYLFFFILIGVILLILFNVRSPFGKNNSSFASEPKEGITRIELSEGGKRLELVKKGDTWVINGKTEARKSGILFIIRVLTEIKIKSPVSPELFKGEITGMNIAPVKVKVYEKRHLLKSFLVYKTRSNTFGNIMRLKGTSKPFIVYIPGYEGDIGSVFIVNELFWQPYTVFNLLPSEIGSVRFDNVADTASSFSINVNDHRYSLGGETGNLTGWDSSRITRYISYFARVPFESWAFDISEDEKKSIAASTPLYKITVVTTSGKTKVLFLWGMTTSKGNTKSINSDRLYGKTEDKDELFVMRYFDIDPLIKKRSYFFNE